MSLDGVKLIQKLEEFTQHYSAYRCQLFKEENDVYKSNPNKLKSGEKKDLLCFTNKLEELSNLVQICERQESVPSITKALNQVKGILSKWESKKSEPFVDSVSQHSDDEMENEKENENHKDNGRETGLFVMDI